MVHIRFDDDVDEDYDDDDDDDDDEYYDVSCPHAFFENFVYTHNTYTHPNTQHTHTFV